MERKLNSARNRWGLAIVEAALVLPLFILVVFGVCEYGFLFLKFQYVANAARQGARTAALSGKDFDDGMAALQGILTDGDLTDAGSQLEFADDEWTATARVEYTELFGLLPVPENLESTAVWAEEP